MRITLEEAMEILNNEGVVAVPTDTLYGLVALPEHSKAVEKIYSLKGRSYDQPLIIFGDSWQQIKPYLSYVKGDIKSLVERYWPGPLTLVVPVEEDKVPSFVRSGLATTGFRVPEEKLTRQLLALSGPLASTSANRSGDPAAISLEQVEEALGKDFPVVDGGECSLGLPSTILSEERISDNQYRWRMLRQGGISAEELETLLGYSLR